jgi:hypothetical protein
MAIYLVVTPSGNRLIQAKTPAIAINFAMGKSAYSAEPLSAPALADWLKQGIQLEDAVVAPKVKVAA